MFIADKEYKELNKQLEYLEKAGGDDEEKAMDFIDERQKKIKQQELADRAEDTRVLNKQVSRKKYHIKLATIALRIADKKDVPSMFKWGIYPDDKGVVFWIRSLNDELYRRAIKPMGQAKADLRATGILIEQLINTALREKDKLNTIVPDNEGKKTGSGIYLPD